MPPQMIELSFEPFGWSHGLPVLVLALAGGLWIRRSQSLSPRGQHLAAVIPACLLPILLVVDVIRASISGTFDPALDLPLHMCRLVTFLVPIMLYHRHRRAFGVLYYWIMAGTLQALITPDLVEDFPQYAYWRYWLLHAGLVLLILYPIFVYRFRPTLRDLWHAVVAAQVFLVLTLPINYLLGANYGYTCEKPPGPSLADLLGPWPIYILVGEVIMILLFLIMYLPFGIVKAGSALSSRRC